MKSYGVLLDQLIRDEINGKNYSYSAADRLILDNMFEEINRFAGININYLAQIDNVPVPGTGEIIKKYLPEFESDSVRAYLIPQIVSDKVRDCDQLVYEMYCLFKQSDNYAVPISNPSPAHIYVRYDNAFHKMKPKRLKKELLALAKCPIDFFYLPLTMRLLASWKIPEMKEILMWYMNPSNIKPSALGLDDVKDGADNRYLLRLRDIQFTAIAGLKYYPSEETKSIIRELSANHDKDIQSAAKKVLKAYEKSSKQQ